jgi:hypothetical protein
MRVDPREGNMSSKGTALGKALAYGLAALICIGAGIGVGRILPFGKSQAAAQKVVAAASRHGMVPAQGITIHGWWTIKVLQDGKLVSQRQFENALTTGGASGQTALAAYLTGGLTPGPWEVLAADDTGATFATFTNSTIKFAGQVGLDVSVNTGDSFTSKGTAALGHIVLTGSYTPTADGNIEFVYSRLFGCGHPTATGGGPSNVPPVDCTTLSFNPGNLTKAVLRDAAGNLAPVAVKAGQQAQITVDLSFS